MYKNSGNGLDKTYNYNKSDKVFNNSEKKPLRYSTDSFIKELIGKKIRICLINNEIFEGTLKELGMYDILISINIEDKTNIAGKEIIRNIVKDRIFMKSAIIWVEVI
jgi:small nuclear ribonucleoprotein (snRNP)-like protein